MLPQAGPVAPLGPALRSRRAAQGTGRVLRLARCYLATDREDGGADRLQMQLWGHWLLVQGRRKAAASALGFVGGVVPLCLSVSAVSHGYRHGLSVPVCGHPTIRALLYRIGSTEDVHLGGCTSRGEDARRCCRCVAEMGFYTGHRTTTAVEALRDNRQIDNHP